MNLIYVVGLAILFPFISHANLYKGLIYHMGWVQQNVNTPHPCPDNVVMTPAQTDELAEVCMSQVCGPSDKVDTSEELAIALMQDPKFIKETSKTILEVLSGINEFLDEATKEKVLTIEAYRDLKQRNDITPTSDYTRLHDLTAILHEWKKATYEAGPNSQIPLIINKNETYAKLAHLPEEQRQWITDSLDHFVKSPPGAEVMLLNINQPRDFLRLKYPNLSFKDALKTEGMATKKLLNGPNGSMLQMLVGVKLTDPSINKAVSGDDMTDAEVSQFFSVKAPVMLFNDVLTAKDQGGQTTLLPTSSHESFGAFIKRKNFDQELSQYENDLKNPQKVREKRQIAFQSCYTNYIFQMATLPSRSQIGVAEQNAEWAKNKVKEILGPALSEQTKQVLNGAIDNSFFAMPRSRETFHQYFMERLKDAKKNSAEAENNLSTLIKSGQHKPLTLLNIHLHSNDFTLDRHFKDALNFCDKFKMVFTSDFAMTSTGGIGTSWVSVRKPEFGKAAMLHELGHVAFNSLESEKASTESRGHFQKIRQCLADNHPKAEEGGEYIEEDWSDLIAGKGSGRDNSNIGCELSDQKNDKYIDLNLVKGKPNDTHSTRLFRALYIYKIQNRKLPSACNQLIEADGADWKFNSCF